MNTDESAGPVVPPPRTLSVRLALLIAIVGTAAAVSATILVLRRNYSPGADAMLAALALVSFGVAAFGLMQSVLALVDSAGERRRQDREVSERRKGERARQPRP